MNWRNIESVGVPAWPEDETQRVLVLTEGHDFAGVQVHDIPVMDFYAKDEAGKTVGTEVTEVVSHWVYRDEIWPTSSAVPNLFATTD